MHMMHPLHTVGAVAGWHEMGPFGTVWDHKCLCAKDLAHIITHLWLIVLKLLGLVLFLSWWCGWLLCVCYAKTPRTRITRSNSNIIGGHHWWCGLLNGCCNDDTFDSHHCIA